MKSDPLVNCFSIPRQVYFGEGSVQKLAETNGNKAFIITDDTMDEIGHMDRVRGLLENGGKSVEIWTGVKPNPARYTVDECVEEVRGFEPDLLIALGGGSAVDTSKAVWFFYECPERDWDFFSTEKFNYPRLGTRKDRKADLVAVPTTSGTGAEMTPFAVITNTERDPVIKQPGASREIIPTMAILDPDLTETMPQEITANTGIDTLSHALESLVNKHCDPFTDALNFHGAAMVFKWLPKAVADGQNMVARLNMHIASGMVGMAEGNTGTGAVHALGHQLVDLGVPHGESMAPFMPLVIEFNSIAVAEKYAELARRLGARFNTPKEGANKLAELVEDLIKDVGVPLSVSKIKGVSKDEYFDKIDDFAGEAATCGTVGPNPREVSVEEAKEFFKEAW